MNESLFNIYWEDIEDISADQGVNIDSKYPVKVTIDLARKAMVLQAQIDRLMLEYCQEEMTIEQKDNWARYQVPVSRKQHIDNETALEIVRDPDE